MHLWSADFSKRCLHVSQQGLMSLWGILLMACGDDKVSHVDLEQSVDRREIAAARPTFTRDVAPIVFSHCTPCHRPGEPAPFTLLDYRSVKKHAKLIAEVTRDRYMPPWLPAHGFNSFEQERWLSPAQIETIGRWVGEGMPEGAAEDLPPLPEFAEGWQLGEPDLVVTLPEPFVLPAEGADIYRNFVVPVPLESAKYVRALEFRPGDTRAVHHAFTLIDTSKESRRLDGNDPEPGFGGMNTGAGARSPDGHFVSWQPGKMPSTVPEGMSWRLAPNTDLVLQIHMQTTGKEERIRPTVGFYFTETPPTRFPYKLVLRSTDIDIPPGESDYAIESSYVLPVDVHALAVIPHAHYLGKQLHAFATLPDGSKQWLLKIDDWDFNWQGDYRYQSQIALPKGSVITQRFTFDNSAQNPRNPNSPPRRVQYGLNTTDEMGEFWLQVLPDNPEDLAVLNRDYGRYSISNRVKQLRKRIESNPNDAETWKELGKSTMAVGTGDEARRHLSKALSIDGELAEAHYLLGMINVKERKKQAAWDAFQRCIRYEPEHVGANNGIGIIAQQSNRLELARVHFQRSVDSDPENVTTLSNLARVLMLLGANEDALPVLQKALDLQPRNVQLQTMLKAVLARP